MTVLTPNDPAIFSFCFAKGRLPRDFIEGAPVASNQGVIDIPMLYSVILTKEEGRRKVILVDTGFSGGKSMTGRSFADFEPPAAILAKVGLTPQDVDAIVMTHLHFDHAGNIDAFPHAPIYLQRREYEQWKHVLARVADASIGKQSWILSSMNLDDWPKIERAVASGRIHFVDGSQTIAPGITLRLAADTHTFGSQWVEVATPDGPYVIAGDTVVSYANMERMWPPGYHQGSAWSLMACYDEVQTLVGAGRMDRIVPGHDMTLFTRVQSFRAGLNPVAEVRAASWRASLVTPENAFVAQGADT